MQSLDYQKCYEILNANNKCSWKQLKKSYRSLIQKWHPDRFINAEEKLIATDKLVEINVAYNKLAKHYREHGDLPRVKLYKEPPNIVENSTKSHDWDTATSTTQNSHKKRQPSKNNIKYKKTDFSSYKVLKANITTIAIIFITVIVGYQLLISIDIPTDFSYTKQDTEYPEPETTKSINKTIDKELEPVIQREIFFTYGSTIGKVILTQGAPDRIDGDIWYYGKSEIHFSKGKVIKWVRSVTTPLKARAIP